MEGLKITAFDDELKKYERREFEVLQKRTLKHGVRYILAKQKKGLSGLLFAGGEGVYIYYVNGNATTDHILEFLKDYGRSYDEFNFSKGDKGLLMVSGDIDEKVFRNLKNSAVVNDKVYESISIKSLGERSVAEEPEVLPQKGVSKQITKKQVMQKRTTEEKTSLEKVVETIDSIQFIRSKKESGYQAQLYQALLSRGYPVVHERPEGGARFDLVIGKNEIAVELKVVKGAGVFDSLVGQTHRYKDQFRKIVVVIIDEIRNPSIIKNGVERVISIDPRNIEVIVKGSL